ncbi:MAG: ATP-grasp domain-containing protein [Lachnospiraceae bacterium]
MPISEKEIVLTNNIIQDLKKMGIYVLINNSKVLGVCSSKYSTAKVLSENGLLSPKTFRLEEYNEGILSYPIVVKGDFSCGSHSLVIAYNKDELDKAVTVISDAILQEYIGSLNEEYTVGVFSDGKETRSIAFRRQLGYGGMSIYVELVNDVQISKIACKIANIFKLCGSINIQMRKHNDKYFIFEINPRLSSTVAFRYKLGFKDIIWWLQMLDEDSVISEYVSIRGDIIGVKKLDEVIFNKSKIFVDETRFNN